MIRVASSDELRQAFRSLDRDQVIVPGDMTFPLAIRDYLAWPEPSGHRIYLVFEDRVTHHPMGMVFERPASAPDQAPQMCQWCHSVRTGNNVSLLTAKVSATRTVGVQLCRDLSCKDKITGRPGVHDLLESLTTRQKSLRLLERMNDFARRNLF